MIRLGDILKEIGDSTVAPYKWEFYGDDDNDIRYYGFYTEHYPYSVRIFQDENQIEIEFSVPDEKDPNIEKWNIETNKGNVYKIMSTVLDIVKADLQKHPEVDTLEFAAVKKQGQSDNNSRSDLYLKYIKHQYPNAQVEKYGDAVLVKIK